MTADRPDIFTFHDYRAFLREWIAYLRGVRPGCSLRALCRNAGLGNGYLPMVLAGRRRLSDKAWAKLAPHLDLTAPERQHFELLRRIADGRTHEARREAFERLQRFRSYRQANPKEMETYRYLTHWFYVAIREMAALEGFQADPKWIHARLRRRPSLKEVEQAWEFLVDNGFLEPLPDGTVRLREKDIRCEGEVFRAALAGFHREMLQLASHAAEDVPRERRWITGHTLAVPEGRFEEVRRILEDALKRVAALEPFDAKGECVYHVAFAAFPLTRIDGE